MHEIGREIKTSLLFYYCSIFILSSAFLCPQSSFLFQYGKKAMNRSTRRRCSVKMVFWEESDTGVFLWISKNTLFTEYLWTNVSLCKHASFFSICFCYYRKHTNKDNKICLLPSSACFPQHFHDYYLISIKSVIWTVDANYFPFHSLNMLSFHISLGRLKQIHYGLILHFSKYYFKTGTILLSQK